MSFLSPPAPIADITNQWQNSFLLSPVALKLSSAQHSRPPLPIDQGCHMRWTLFLPQLVKVGEDIWGCSLGPLTFPQTTCSFTPPSRHISGLCTWMFFLLFYSEQNHPSRPGLNSISTQEDPRMPQALITPHFSHIPGLASTIQWSPVLGPPVLFHITLPSSTRF